MALLVIVGAFVEYGTTSRSARWFGAGRYADAVDEGVQASWLAGVIGLAVVVLGEVFAGPLTRLLAGGTNATQHAAEDWFRIAVIGMPGVLIVLAGNGWMRGVQRTREPVVIVVVANAISAAASPILVYPLGLGLVGSAYANVGAQAIGAALFVRALRRASHRAPATAGGDARATGGRPRSHRAVARRSRWPSSPPPRSPRGWGPRRSLHTRSACSCGSSPRCCSTPSPSRRSRSSAPRSAPRPPARPAHWPGRWRAGDCGPAAPSPSSMRPAGSRFRRLFTSSHDVIDQVHVLWPWFVGMLPAAGVVFALDGVLIGAGDVAFLRTITVIAAVGAFFPINLATLAWHWGLGGVWAGLTAFVVVRLIGMLVRTRGGRWAVTGV